MFDTYFTRCTDTMQYSAKFSSYLSAINKGNTSDIVTQQRF